MKTNPTGTAPEPPTLASLVMVADALDGAFGTAQGVADTLDSLAMLDEGMYPISRATLRLLANSLSNSVEAGSAAARQLTEGEAQP
jgi:hypothetical protein